MNQTIKVRGKKIYQICLKRIITTIAPSDKSVEGSLANVKNKEEVEKSAYEKTLNNISDFKDHNDI